MWCGSFVRAVTMKKIILFVLLLTAALAAGAQRRSVAILGDSYSTFKGFVEPETNRIWYKVDVDTAKTDVSSVRQTWWHRFISENDLKLERNNSFSGATVCNTGYKGKDYSDRSFIARMKDLGRPDIILILGATNDCWAHSPIGEYKYAGWTAEDLYSFRPAMSYMLDTMKDYYPGTDIYFVLNCRLSDDINESVHTICERYGVPVVNLVDIDCKANHPTQKGMAQIAEQVKAAIIK